MQEGRKIQVCCNEIEIKDSLIEKILKKMYLIFENICGLRSEDAEIMRVVNKIQN